MIFCLILVLWFCWPVLYPGKLNKSDLAALYAINMRTLGKWVKWFGPFDLRDRWIGIRKLTAYEFRELLVLFESPDAQLVKTKGMVMEECESSYKVMRKMSSEKFIEIGYMGWLIGICRYYRQTWHGGWRI